MASNLQKKKEEISKLRRKTQRELEKAKSLSRSSISGVTSLKKRVETTQSHLSEVSSDLHRRVSQQESIMRLTAAAQERLKREMELKELLIICSISGTKFADWQSSNADLEPYYAKLDL